MKTINQFSVLVLPVFALILSLPVGGFGPSFAESLELSTAVFTVQ
jgi:hypothetical protein